MLHIYSQVLASIIHPRTSLITFHIIHIPFPYYKYVSRAQAPLILRQSCLPSLARITRHGRANQRARLSPSRVNMQMSAPISSLIPVRMSTVLLLHWHSCRIAHRPTYTSNITLGYKAQTPPAKTQIPQMLHMD